MILPLASWSSLKFYVFVCYPEILDLRSLCKSAHWHEHSCQESQSRQASRDLSRSCIPAFSFSLQEPLFRESFLRLRFQTVSYIPGGPCCHTFCCLSPFPTSSCLAAAGSSRSLLGRHSLSFPLAAAGSWASWVARAALPPPAVASFRVQALVTWLYAIPCSFQGNEEPPVKPVCLSTS